MLGAREQFYFGNIFVGVVAAVGPACVIALLVFYKMCSAPNFTARIRSADCAMVGTSTVCHVVKLAMWFFVIFIVLERSLVITHSQIR